MFDGSLRLLTCIRILLYHELGAHTNGVAHCSSFNNCLHSFIGNGNEHPALDHSYASNLKKFKQKVPNDCTTIVEMDPGSFRTLNIECYKLLLKKDELPKACIAEVSLCERPTFAKCQSITGINFGTKNVVFCFKVMD